MPSAIDVVTEFLRECGRDKPSMQAAFRRWFTDATTWENVGFARTAGPDEAIALMQNFEDASGIVTFRARIDAIAAQGNLVLTERFEDLLAADGTIVRSMPLMGIFEVEGSQIVAWRDYYDTASMAAS